MLYRFFKRLFDLVCALIGIIGTSPIWILSIILTEISDPGPLFYFAHRVGKDNKLFYVYKFRTMHCNTRNVATDELTESVNCITKSGRFLYRYNIIICVLARPSLNTVRYFLFMQHLSSVPMFIL